MRAADQRRVARVVFYYYYYFFLFHSISSPCPTAAAAATGVVCLTRGHHPSTGIVTKSWPDDYYIIPD